MHHFEYIKLKNYVRYKEAILDLNYNGITVIRGRNNKAGPEASNGSGKSLMVGALPNLRYDTTPLSSLRNGAKKGIFRSGTSIETKLDGIVIQKKQRKSKLYYVFKKNGKDAKVRTIALAKEKLQKLFPLTEEEFYSTVYIDARRPLLFSLGTPAKRFDFFTALFRLHNYDDIRAFFNAKIRDINKNKSLLESLRKEVKELEQGKVVELPEVKQCIEDSRKKRIKLANFQRRLFDKLALAKDLKEAKETKRRVDEESKKYGKVLSEVLTAFKKKLKRRMAWDIYIGAERQYKVNKQTFLDQLDGTQFTSARQVKKELIEQKRIYEQQTKLRTKIKDLKLEIKGLRFDKNDLKLYNKASKHSIKKLERLLDKSRSEKALLSEFKKSLHGHDEGVADDKCPVCRSEVKGRDKLVQELDARVERHATLCVKLQGYLQAYEAYETKIKMSEIDKQLATLSADLVKVDIEKLEEQHILFTKLEHLEIPKKPAQDPVNDTVEQIEKDIQRVQKTILLQNNIRNVDFTVKLNPVNIEDQLATVETKLSKLNSLLEKLTAQYEVGTKTAKQLREKKSQVIELEFEAKDLDIYEMLVGAYKTEGLKLLMIKRIAKIVEGNLNRYASLLFHEPYKFNIEVAKNSFNLICYELEGKKKVEQRDIRHFSGAEARAFSLLFSLALLPLIPKERRANILILDEPDTNFDKRMSRSFVEDFLPKLNSLIPHIIHVTPQDTYIPYAREYIAVKEGKYTKLVKMHD